ncbi:transposase [Spiroplasma ixodetis]|uniref:Transposase n=1 Tax=Spiroplasma ixodetis TaxID=2141 RepID=A0ABM8BUJ2_9MOLU|nr:transposase [Spiroplasma ixodetis]BDT03541.1 hypothetical protein SHM_11870 [Spiroplasma ixodetis]
MTNINSYTDEFKKQIVALYQSGKSVSCLAKEYNVTRAATYKWIKQFTNSGSFKIKNWMGYTLLDTNYVDKWTNLLKERNYNYDQY